MTDKRAWILMAVVMALALLGLLLMTSSLMASAPQADWTVQDRPQAVAAGTGWSSGWITVAQGACQQLNHNLGSDPNDYAVEMWFWDADNDRGVNRRSYGGLEIAGYWRGAFFQQLETNTLAVCRMGADLWADQIWVRVWQPPDPYDYDSGWLDIDPDETLVVTHGLGISATELHVGLWFSSTARGIHHAGYGGLYNDLDEQLQGAYWKNLTDNTVRVRREPDDTLVEQVRVVVTHPDPPDYDSLVTLGDWQDITWGEELTFTHNLDWPPSLLTVRAECKSTPWPGPGIHQQYAGGNHDWFIGWQGASVQNLTPNSVQIAREVNDQACPQVRVRIWKRAFRQYLPIITRNTPPAGTSRPLE